MSNLNKKTKITRIGDNVKIERTGAKFYHNNKRPMIISLVLSSKRVHEIEDLEENLLKPFIKEINEKLDSTEHVYFIRKNDIGVYYFQVIFKGYVHWNEIQSIWNRIQNKEGYNYVDKYSTKMQDFFKDGFKMQANGNRNEEKQRKAYEKNKLINWTQPNSTDVAAVYKCKWL